MNRVYPAIPTGVIVPYKPSQGFPPTGPALPLVETFISHRRWNHVTYGPEYKVYPTTQELSISGERCELCGFSHRSESCCTACTAKTPFTPVFSRTDMDEET